MKVQSLIRRNYRASYDRIAHDHVSHWRATGANPFQGAEHIRANEDSTVRLIEKHTVPCTWLDVGCGMGDLLGRLPDYNGIGVDISSEYLAVAQERGLIALKGNAEELPFAAKSCRLVTATDLLEHVLDVNKVCAELLRVLAPGGTLIVRTPHNEDIGYFCTYDTYEYVHLRNFDAPSLWLLFTKVFGCDVLETPVDGDVVHAVVRK